MATEKMSLVYIEGALKKIDKTLMKCYESNCFHIIAPKNTNGDNRWINLKSENPFASLVDRSAALADALGIEIKKTDYDDVGADAADDFDGYLKDIEKRLNHLNAKKRQIQDSLREHSVSLMRAEKLSGFDADFSELFACKYVKLRFGQLPLDSVAKLEYYSSMNFVYFIFSEEDGYAQMLYLTPDSDVTEVDNVFNLLFFERIRLPDYFHGNADEARTKMLKLVISENENLDEINADIVSLRNEVEEEFLKITSKLTAIDQSYDLRRNVSAVNDKFYMSGYVPKRKLKSFINSIEAIPDVRALSLWCLETT